MGLPLISAVGNIAQSNIGAVIAMRLTCHYDGLKFVPLKPVLESTTALAWKRSSFFRLWHLRFWSLRRNTFQAYLVMIYKY